MKTPKRVYASMGGDTEDAITARKAKKCARWKRENRTKRLKRTISILKHRLKDTEETLRITQKITKCFIVKPDHWHHLDENGNELTRKQWRIKIKKEETAACHPETTQNGQQDCSRTDNSTAN